MDICVGRGPAGVGSDFVCMAEDEYRLRQPNSCRVNPTIRSRVKGTSGPWGNLALGGLGRTGERESGREPLPLAWEGLQTDEGLSSHSSLCRGGHCFCDLWSRKQLGLGPCLLRGTATTGLVRAEAIGVTRAHESLLFLEAGTHPAISSLLGEDMALVLC